MSGTMDKVHTHPLWHNPTLLLVLFTRCGSRSLRTRDKGRMICVDVCCLNSDQALRIFRRRTEAFAQELRNDVNELRMQTGKPLQFLR